MSSQSTEIVAQVKLEAQLKVRQSKNLLPQLMKINQLHLKNQNKILKSQAKIYDLIQQYQTNKENYMNSAIRTDNERISVLTLRKLQKSRIHLKKINESIEKNQHNSTKITMSFEAKLQKNKKEIQRKLMEAEGRKKTILSSEKIKPILDKRYVINLNKENQIKRSHVILTECNERMKQALSRRIQNKQKKVAKGDNVDKKIIDAKKVIQKNQQIRENNHITKLIKKHKKFQQFKQQISNDILYKMGRSKKQNEQKLENTLLRKTKIFEDKDKVKQQQINKKFQKIEKYKQKRLEHLENISQNFHDKSFISSVRAEERVRQIFSIHMNKNNDIQQKYQTQWNFVTEIRKSKEKLIQSNIFMNTKLSLRPQCQIHKK